LSYVEGTEKIDRTSYKSSVGKPHEMIILLRARCLSNGHATIRCIDGLTF